MELLLNVLEWLNWFLFGMAGSEVNLAIAPAVVALGAGLVGGGLNYVLGGKERRRNRRREKKARNRMLEGFGEADTAIDRVLGAAESINTNQSTEDLFGDTVENLSDRVAASQGTSAAALSRAGTASGGDVTGGLNVALQRLTEGSNRSIMDIINEYNQRTTQFNLNQQGIKNQMLQNVAGSRQNLLGILSGQAEAATNRRIDKQTADKQFFLDAIGTGASAGSIFQGG